MRGWWGNKGEDLRLHTSRTEIGGRGGGDTSGSERVEKIVL